MKTSGQNRQKVYIVTYLICVIQVYGASLTITQYPQYPTVSTNAILTCHIPSFTVGAQWFRNGSSLTLCQSSLCFPPSITGYQFTADATTMNVTISSINIALGDTIWRCSHNGGNDIGSIILTVYKPPSSSLSIVGDNNRTLADGDTVVLSVSTGCITPSDSAHYNVTWKYVEANNTAEKNFDEKITQYVNSSGGCTNTYEDNLQFNLIVTNDINTANTDLYISQVKMTFTMAGTDFIATKTVSYTLKAKATTTTTTTTTTGTTTTTTITTSTTTGTSTSLNSTSMPSSTSNVSIDNTTMKPTTTGPGASTTNTSSMLISSTTDNSNNTSGSTTTRNTSTVPGSSSINPTTILPTNDPNNTSGSTTTRNTTSNGTKSNASDTNIKVIVPAIVVPCGLLIIGAIIFLVVWCVRRRAGKNVPQSQDGIGIKYRDKNKDRWKPSTGHGKVTNNHGEYITPDGFIIYPGPAARSTARSYKDKKSHGVTDQYSRPDSWTYHHQADYTPNTYTSAYTHKGKHRVTDQYSEPYTAAYSYQTAYLPSTHKSARTYEQKAKNYDNEIHQQASHPMATSRLAYGQTAYYPQTGFYGQSSHDAYYRGDGQYSYGQMSRSHRDYNRQKQQRDYYSQYEMTDYRHDKRGDIHTKQDTAFYY